MTKYIKDREGNTGDIIEYIGKANRQDHILSGGIINHIVIYIRIIIIVISASIGII